MYTKNANSEETATKRTKENVLYYTSYKKQTKMMDKSFFLNAKSGGCGGVFRSKCPEKKKDKIHTFSKNLNITDLTFLVNSNQRFFFCCFSVVVHLSLCLSSFCTSNSKSPSSVIIIFDRSVWVYVQVCFADPIAKKRK